MQSYRSLLRTKSWKRSTCYFLLNYADRTGTRGGAVETNRLAIFFWIMHHVAYDYIGGKRFFNNLLFSFELCHGQVHGKQWQALWWCLAIFFWIMPVRGPTCSRWVSKLKAFSGTCYFLLNYAGEKIHFVGKSNANNWLAIFFWIMLSWQSGERKAEDISDLLFSFELCSTPYCRAYNYPKSLTCYFLLNYAANTHLSTSKAVAILNLLFSFELCQESLARS